MLPTASLTNIDIAELDQHYGRPLRRAGQATRLREGLQPVPAWRSGGELIRESAQHGRAHAAQPALGRVAAEAAAERRAEADGAREDGLLGLRAPLVESGGPPSDRRGHVGSPADPGSRKSRSLQPQGYMRGQLADKGSLSRVFESDGEKHNKAPAKNVTRRSWLRPPQTPNPLRIWPSCHSNVRSCHVIVLRYRYHVVCIALHGTAGDTT